MLKERLFFKWFIVISLIILQVSTVHAGGLSDEERGQILERLEELNLKYERGEITWKPGVTEFTFMTDKEIKDYLGLTDEDAEEFFKKRDDSCIQAEELTHLELLPQQEHLPTKFDWRNNNGNWVTSVKKQVCGNCWAYTAIATLETTIMIDGGIPDEDIDLSEAFLTSCPRSDPEYEDHLCGCNGRPRTSKENYEFDYSLRYLVEKGTVPEDCLPSTRENSSTWGCKNACADWEAKIIKASDYKEFAFYQEVPQGQEFEELINTIKHNIMEYGLIATSMSATEDFIRFYNGSVWRGPCDDERFYTNHGVAIVGWDDNTRSWIVKNTWGENWGENGYFRIGWESCGISLNPCYLTYGYEDGKVNSIAVSPHQRGKICVTVDRTNASDRLYISVDGGENWELIRGFYTQDEVLHDEHWIWEEVKEYYDDGPISNVVVLRNDEVMLLEDSKPWLLKYDNIKNLWEWEQVSDQKFQKISADPRYRLGRAYGINSSALWRSTDSGRTWKEISNIGGIDFAVNKYGPIYFVNGLSGLYYLDSESAYYATRLSYRYDVVPSSVAVSPSTIYRSIIGTDSTWSLYGYGNPPSSLDFLLGNLWANAPGRIEGWQKATIWTDSWHTYGVGRVRDPYTYEVKDMPLLSLDYGNSWWYPASFPEDGTVYPYAIASERDSTPVYVGGSINDGGSRKPAIFKHTGAIPPSWKTIVVD